MNAKVGDRRRGTTTTQGNYHNFIISFVLEVLFRGRATFKRTSDTLYLRQPHPSSRLSLIGCFSSSPDGFVSQLVSRWEHMYKLLPRVCNCLGNSRRDCTRRINAYLFNKIPSFIPRDLFSLFLSLSILSLTYCQSKIRVFAQAGVLFTFACHIICFTI